MMAENNREKRKLKTDMKDVKARLAFGYVDTFDCDEEHLYRKS